MGFRRQRAARAFLDEDQITEAMTSIGMVFAARRAPAANIEDTLVAASERGLLRDDLRTLAILVTWLGVHTRMINADRLRRPIEDHEARRVRAFWSAFALWQR